MTNKSSKTGIRVVKRGERTRRETTSNKSELNKTAQETARDMVAIVTGWVGELQHRHRTDTARALKNLFPETTPQVN